MSDHNQTAENIFFYQNILSAKVSTHLEYQNLIYNGLHIIAFVRENIGLFESTNQLSISFE